MARKPNYQFERMERQRAKDARAAEKAAAKRSQRESRATPDDPMSDPDADTAE